MRRGGGGRPGVERLGLAREEAELLPLEGPAPLAGTRARTHGPQTKGRATRTLSE